MRSGRFLLVGGLVLLGISVAVGQQARPVVKDSAPWHIHATDNGKAVARLNTARDGAAGAAEAGAQKYLHIQVDFKIPPEAQKRHKFRVVNDSGEEVGEMWGWNDSRSLVIFEGQWGSLAGLWLEGNGYKEPLFTVAAAPTQVARAAPVTPAPGVVERRPDVVVDRRPDVVVDRGRRDVIVDRRPDVVVDRSRRDVIVDRGPDRVIVDRGRDVVVDRGHDHGRDAVIIDRGRDVVVDRGRDVVVDRGHDVVVDRGGKTIVGGGDSVVGRGTGSGTGSGSSSNTSPSSQDSGEADKSKPEDCPPDSGKPDSGKPDKSKPSPSAADNSKPEDCPPDSGKPDKSKPSPSAADDSKPEDCPPDSGKPDKSKPIASPPGKDGPGSGDCPPGKDGPGSGDCPPGKDGPGTGDCPPGKDGPGTAPDGPGPKPDGPGPEGPGPKPGPKSKPGELAMNNPPIKDLPSQKKDYDFVLYISTGTDTSPGMVYQVTDEGRVLGKVKTPYTPTGMALHRDNGLVLAVPRDGGKIMRIDDTGKLATVLEKDKSLPNPVDVGIGANSDTVVVADNIADVLAATTTQGTKPRLYQRFEGQKWASPRMAVAVTKDKNVIFSSDAEPGVYRFSGSQPASGNKPVLPASGGVAADTKSLRWAAGQEPNLVYIYEGQELVKKLRLPAGKSLYRKGLLSFSPSGTLCVACRDNDSADKVWLLMYNIDKDETYSLFPWDKGEMTDFVVGPRMLWERNDPSASKSTY